MKDYRFGSQDGVQSSYYVFTDAQRIQDEAAFYRFDTPQEACALFNYLQVAHPGTSFSLGVHKDGTRRADIVEQLEGVTVLSDDYKCISPWKNDPTVAAAAEVISRRLNATWKIDRELIDQRIIVPNEIPISSYVPWYLEDRRLLPDSSGHPKSSIQELNVEGAGWMSPDDVKSLAKGRGCFTPAMPVVSELLVSYQVGEKGLGGTMAISPAEYAFLEKQYLARQQEVELKPSDPALAGREASLPSPAESQSLDNLKRDAKERVLQKGQSYSARRETSEHAHSL